MADFNSIFEPQNFDELVEQKLEDIALSFQLALQDCMKLKGVNKTELAQLMGVSSPRVSQLLSGLGENITLKSIAKAAAALDVDFEAVEKNAYLELLNTGKANAAIAAPQNLSLIRSKSFWKDSTANENKYPLELAA